ncbi:MAG: chromosome partitioning protein ParA [Phycisphaerae bacterium SM23_30]|nr:MAG: chromosome partitioning protein ParA [Phycisphaerae bacterium SM23_30]
MTNRRGEEAQERQQLSARLSQIRYKILVLSGKGGVGKSTVAVNLALALGRAGHRVGLLDVDIHGPSIPKLLGLEGKPVGMEEEAIAPVSFGEHLKVMSIGFLLRQRDDALIWRGPMKMGVIKQFLKDVAWGQLDYLVIDLPPGTGDEPLSVCQLIEDADGAVIVTTPQELAVIDVRKCISFCRQLNLRVLGVIENMSGFVCPHCGEATEIFKRGGGERMARELAVPFLGCIPIDPQITAACDEGKPFVDYFAGSESAGAFERALGPILRLEERDLSAQPQTTSITEVSKSKEHKTMRIAIPTAGGKLTAHFGHCEQFALIEVDTEKKEILQKEVLDSPPHQPGLLPSWLAERGANVIIAGGMGQRAQNLFAEKGIEVIVGAPSLDAETIVENYLNETLQAGENICDH